MPQTAVQTEVGRGITGLFVALQHIHALCPPDGGAGVGGDGDRALAAAHAPPGPLGLFRPANNILM